MSPTLEAVTVYRHTAGAIAVRKVTSLNHELDVHKHH